MNRIINYMLEFITVNQKLDKDNREIIRYGLELIVIKTMFTLSAVIIASILNCFWECIVFLMAFSVIRTSAGGYHSKTRVQCFIMSMLMIIINIGVVKLIAHYISIYYILAPLALISKVVIWFLSPVDTENRPLEHDEKIRFKKRTRVLLCLELVLEFIMVSFNLRIMVAVILLSTVFVAVLLIMELIVKRKNNGL